MMPKRELLLYLTCLVELIINIFYNWSKNLGIWSFNYRKSQINENFKLTKISKFNINLHSIRIESTFLLVTLPINIDPSRLYNYLKIRNKIRLYFLKWSRLQLWVGILDRTELYRSLAFFVYRFDRSAFKTEIYPHIFNKLFIVLQQIFTLVRHHSFSANHTLKNWPFPFCIWKALSVPYKKQKTVSLGKLTASRTVLKQTVFRLNEASVKKS